MTAEKYRKWDEIVNPALERSRRKKKSDPFADEISRAIGLDEERTDDSETMAGDDIWTEERDSPDEESPQSVEKMKDGGDRWDGTDEPEPSYEPDVSPRKSAYDRWNEPEPEAESPDGETEEEMTDEGGAMDIPDEDPADCVEKLRDGGDRWDGTDEPEPRDIGSEDGSIGSLEPQGDRGEGSGIGTLDRWSREPETVDRAGPGVERPAPIEEREPAIDRWNTVDEAPPQRSEPPPKVDEFGYSAEMTDEERSAFREKRKKLKGVMDEFMSWKGTMD